MLQFKQIQHKEYIKKLEKQIEFLKRNIDFHIEDLFDLCECNHLDTGHAYCIGACEYENCMCKKFVQKEFFLSIPILKVNIFQFENPDMNSEDDPNFWLRFEEWEKEYVNKASY